MGTPDRYSVLQTVNTMKGAKTLGRDSLEHRAFLSAKAPAASAGTPAAPGAAPPGSLVVLVVEPWWPRQC
jgi:hypothetical protein